MPKLAPERALNFSNWLPLSEFAIFFNSNGVNFGELFSLIWEISAIFFKSFVSFFKKSQAIELITLGFWTKVLNGSHFSGVFVNSPFINSNFSSLNLGLSVKPFKFFNSAIALSRLNWGVVFSKVSGFWAGKNDLACIFFAPMLLTDDKLFICEIAMCTKINTTYI